MSERSICVQWAGAGWPFAVVLATILGCGGAPEEQIEQRGAASDNLRILERAYRTALDQTRQPPKSRDDLVRHLPADTDVEQLLVSPHDDQPFVIVWGTDLTKLMTSPRPIVFAYESQGRDGNRFVLTTMGVMELTDEDFAAASFPDGHSPSP